jgi:serine/threonine protein kinase
MQRLRQRAASGRLLTLQERCRIALQACLGMAYLHDQRPAVIHFDLKPDNLLVEGEGEDVLVKVSAMSWTHQTVAPSCEQGTQWPLACGPVGSQRSGAPDWMVSLAMLFRRREVPSALYA